MKASSYISRIFQASFNIIVKMCPMGPWKKDILNRREKSTSTAALVCVKLRYFSILWKFSLRNNKKYSVEINSKPKNCAGWTKGFFSRPLSNKKVIGSTEINLGDFLRPKIYYKIEMKVIFTERFSWFKNFVYLSDTEFKVLWEFKEEKPHVSTAYYKFLLLFCNCDTSKIILNCKF